MSKATATVAAVTAKKPTKKVAPKKKVVSKKVAPKKTSAKKKTGGKKAEANGSRRGRKISADRLANMLKVLKHLAKLPSQKDGLSRVQLREKLKIEILGTPELEKRGLVSKAGGLEGTRGNVYKITPQGRKAAKAGKIT